MKTKAFKIQTQSNIEAISLGKHLEESDIIPDVREGKVIYLSIESLVLDNGGELDNLEEDIPSIQEEIVGVIEDFQMVYEVDNQPEIEIVDYDFNQDNPEEGIDQS